MSHVIKQQKLLQGFCQFLADEEKFWMQPPLVVCSQAVLVHFTRLGNYQLIKNVVQSVVTSHATSSRGILDITNASNNLIKWWQISEGGRVPCLLSAHPAGWSLSESQVRKTGFQMGHNSQSPKTITSQSAVFALIGLASCDPKLFRFHQKAVLSTFCLD
jgi:hypothetical protein